MRTRQLITFIPQLIRLELECILRVRTRADWTCMDRGDILLFLWCVGIPRCVACAMCLTHFRVWLWNKNGRVVVRVASSWSETERERLTFIYVLRKTRDLSRLRNVIRTGCGTFVLRLVVDIDWCNVTVLLFSHRMDGNYLPSIWLGVFIRNTSFHWGKWVWN